jgi:cytoskeletal protein CcmA (bactofilin family)
MPSGRPDYSVTVYGTVAITGGVVITGVVSITGTVTVTGAVTVTGTVSITGTVTVTGAVTVTGTVSITGTVTITGAVTVTGSVTVSGTVAISGTVTISGSVSITGTVTISGAVTITSGAVTITTSGGTNLVIDKITQAAYLARIHWPANDGDPAAPAAPANSVTGTAFFGKFFPRGMRGVLNNLSLYCKRTGAGTITLSYSPTPGIGPVGTVAITPGAAWDWVSSTIRRMWNYDSLWVWISACSADVSWGYDSTSPSDTLRSSDSGVTWYDDNLRIYIRSRMEGATVGDLPVSGTVNNVPIPCGAAESYGDAVACAGSVETTVLTIAGAGKCSYIAYFIYTAAACDSAVLKVYCDGVLAWSGYPLRMSLWGHTASTPGASLLKWAANTSSSILLTIPFEFRRELKIAVLATTATAQSVDIRATPNMIK